MVEQGYAFKVMNTLVDDVAPGLQYGDAESRIQLLMQVKSFNPKDSEIEGDEDEDIVRASGGVDVEGVDMEGVEGNGAKLAPKRKTFSGVRNQKQLLDQG